MIKKNVLFTNTIHFFLQNTSKSGPKFTFVVPEEINVELWCAETTVANQNFLMITENRNFFHFDYKTKYMQRRLSRFVGFWIYAKLGSAKTNLWNKFEKLSTISLKMTESRNFAHTKQIQTSLSLCRLHRKSVLFKLQPVKIVLKKGKRLSLLK